jgi:uncharacterized protein (DUF2237 family)
MTYQRRVLTCIFPALGPATAGACVPRAGKRRWMQAPPPGVVLEATHEETLAIVTLDVLKAYAVSA